MKKIKAIIVFRVGLSLFLLIFGMFISMQINKGLLDLTWKVSILMLICVLFFIDTVISLIGSLKKLQYEQLNVKKQKALERWEKSQKFHEFEMPSMAKTLNLNDNADTKDNGVSQTKTKTVGNDNKNRLSIHEQESDLDKKASAIKNQGIVNQLSDEDDDFEGDWDDDDLGDVIMIKPAEPADRSQSVPSAQEESKESNKFNDLSAWEQRVFERLGATERRVVQFKRPVNKSEKIKEQEVDFKAKNFKSLSFWRIDQWFNLNLTHPDRNLWIKSLIKEQGMLWIIPLESIASLDYLSDNPPKVLHNHLIMQESILLQSQQEWIAWQGLLIEQMSENKIFKLINLYPNFIYLYVDASGLLKIMHWPKN